jgi:uncharacterized membrane protein YqjE
MDTNMFINGALLTGLIIMIVALTLMGFALLLMLFFESAVSLVIATVFVFLCIMGGFIYSDAHTSKLTDLQAAQCNVDDADRMSKDQQLFCFVQSMKKVLKPEEGFNENDY